MLVFKYWGSGNRSFWAVILSQLIRKAGSASESWEARCMPLIPAFCEFEAWLSRVTVRLSRTDTYHLCFLAVLLIYDGCVFDESRPWTEAVPLKGLLYPHPLHLCFPATAIRKSLLYPNSRAKCNGLKQEPIRIAFVPWLYPFPFYWINFFKLFIIVYANESCSCVEVRGQPAGASSFYHGSEGSNSSHQAYTASVSFLLSHPTSLGCY